MSLCRSCAKDVGADEQVVQYVKVGACTASVMVCVWCFSGRKKSEEPLAPEVKPAIVVDLTCGDDRWGKAEVRVPLPNCRAKEKE